MTDHELIRSCDEAVQRERDALADVLRHLREIDRRRLFSELNYKSLFDYCVRRLGYSEDQAYRRISAMRLIKQLPEAEAKIEEGTLSLSNASLLQRAISQGTFKLDSKDHEGKELDGRKLSKTQILQLINKVENKSRREAEKILGSEKITYHLSVTETTDVKFQNLKGLTGHKYKNVSELFDAMVDLALDEKHGLLPRKPSLAKKHRIMASSKAETQTQSQTQTTNAQSSNTVDSKADDSNAEVEDSTSMETTGEKLNSNAVGLKASNLDLKCTRCGSTHALQTEHIIPRAKGGTDDLANLTLLCRNCNQRAAIREFGLKKMDRFLNR